MKIMLKEFEKCQFWKKERKEKQESWTWQSENIEKLDR